MSLFVRYNHCNLCDRELDLEENNKETCNSCQSMSERVTQTININDVTLIDAREGDFFRVVNHLGWVEAFFGCSVVISTIRLVQERDLGDSEINLEVAVNGNTLLTNRAVFFDELMDGLPDLQDCD